MKNSKLRRALLLVASAVLLVCVSVGATLAYLTAQTAVVTNTFTIGEGIHITLLEGKVWPAGQEPNGDSFGRFMDEENRIAANEYKMIPNWTYDKDPEVTVLANSGDCYLFVKVANNLSGVEATTFPIHEQMYQHGWYALELPNADGSTTAVPGVYYYYQAVQTDDEDQVFPVFDTFTTGDYDSDTVPMIADPTIKIDAYAIQTDGFDDVFDAWTSNEHAFEI